jgi:nucleotide-binding universal stress UspA family protein
MFKQILVPLDGSETAENVFPFVIKEAQLHGAKVLLLRVIAPLRKSLMASPSTIDLAFEQINILAREYLETVKGKIESEGIAVETKLIKGRPAQSILDIAESESCDLIIISSYGETNARQWRFGSVANKVVKAKTSIPVMIIPT